MAEPGQAHKALVAVGPSGFGQVLPALGLDDPKILVQDHGLGGAGRHLFRIAARQDQPLGVEDGDDGPAFLEQIAINPFHFPGKVEAQAQNAEWRPGLRVQDAVGIDEDSAFSGTEIACAKRLVVAVAFESLAQQGIT